MDKRAEMEIRRLRAWMVAGDEKLGRTWWSMVLAVVVTGLVVGLAFLCF